MKHFLFSGTLSKVTSSENNATDGMQVVDEEALERLASQLSTAVRSTCDLGEPAPTKAR